MIRILNKINFEFWREKKQKLKILLNFEFQEAISISHVHRISFLCFNILLEFNYYSIFKILFISDLIINFHSIYFLKFKIN